MTEITLEIAFEKQYVLKDLDNVQELSSDLNFVSLEDIDKESFIKTFRQCLIGISARDFKSSNPRKQFEDLISFAGANFHPQSWLLARQDQKIIGMVLPQSYGEDSPGDGSLFFIGIVPEFRGRGLGRILHAKGIKILSELGLKRYIGSTDVLNKAMLEVF